MSVRIVFSPRESREEMMKVLIVDDDRDVRDLLVGFLEFEDDLEPVLAENGLVAKHILEEEVVAAVIVDLSMPVMNGLQLLKWLQQGGLRRFR